MRRRGFLAQLAGHGAAALPLRAMAQHTPGGYTLQDRARLAHSRQSLPVKRLKLRYGAGEVMLTPGIYEYGQTLELDGDLRLAAAGPPGSVVLKYTGGSDAIVVNSRTQTLSSAPENVRSFAMENISVVAERARCGILIGARTQPGITLQGVGIYGVAGPAVHCGEAVYFLALHHCTVRECAAPVYVGAYCDLFTVDDRSLFTDNAAGALLLECPTFLVSNADFESNGGLADIIVRNASGIAGNRNGLLLKNRHGPEVRPGIVPVQHDVALIEAAGLPPGSAMTNLRLWANDHFSGGSFPPKQSPLLLDARVRRLDIRGERHGGYAASDYATTTDAALSHGVGTTWDNDIDDLPVQDALRGLFRRSSPDLRLGVAVEPLAAGTALRLVGHRRSDAGEGPAVATLRASANGTDYGMFFGWQPYATPAERPVEMRRRGAVVSLALDVRGAAHMAPLYLQRDGTAGLTVPAGCAPLRIGRLLDARGNATILLD
ncbi:Uncharacterised protein [Bordetella ansorpii]|uniref:Uncharacterized protein n=1 Tax=Bordetella ansorpii TaxID=288768 RepID=A0A157STQ9_9BORD|nr:hypothetical protein [Bordetella ansorpii]SAI73878.1 Uncharacterised protein [Bordetella ansorpii]